MFDGFVLMTSRKYAAFSGWIITFVTGLSAIMMQATRNGNDLWLSYWVDSTGGNQKAYSTTFYLVIFLPNIFLD